MTCLTLTSGFALGALTMYFFDPERGRHRRALCMGQLSSAARTLRDEAESTARDLTNRTRGRLAEAGSVMTSDTARGIELKGDERAAA